MTETRTAKIEQQETFSSLSNKKTRNFNDFHAKFKKNKKKNALTHRAAEHKESKEFKEPKEFSDAARKFFALPEITAIIGVVVFLRSVKK